MKKTAFLWILFLLFSVLHATVTAHADDNRYLQAQPDRSLPDLTQQLSPDSFSVTNSNPTLVIVADPNPEMQNLRSRGPTAAQALAGPAAAASTFSFTYLAAGQSDPWGQVCAAFPENAKAAFQAAAAIWGTRLQSAVPVTIRACWANLGSSNILGYSGGAPSHRDFTGAPKAGVWYEASLANSLAGVDLGPTYYDMNITYNSGFTWYYGTDGNPPAGQYDLVTVAAHEIAHGLNFSGTASWFGGSGSFGISGYPNIYDTFMKSATGAALTSYANPSASLGTLLTSGSLWFDGANAKAANGGSRVRIYAPSTWSGGSSYSHLDYGTFAGTTNSMMVYAVGSGSANHNPGAVTLGLLRDLGWKMPSGDYSMSGTVRSGSTTGPALAGATVSIAGKSVVTSSTGTFSITGIPAGTYTLTIAKSGYTTKTVTGYVVNSNQTGLVFYLTAAPLYSMSGTVRQGSTTGPLLAGVTLTIAGKTAVTSSTGAFLITGIPAGTYTLTLSKSAYLTQTVSNYVVNSNQSGLVFVLQLAPTYSMSGTVRQGSTTGPVLAGATVAIAGKTAVTTSTGAFTIPGIPSGIYTLTISKTGYVTKNVTGYVINRNLTGLVFYLTAAPTYSMSGTVRQGSTTGPVLSGATVSIAGKSVLTGSTGAFSITGIPAGTYTLTISKTGYNTKTVTGYVINSNLSGLVFYLSPSTANGAVRTVNGSPSYTITELYLSPSSSSTWGLNQLTSPIPVGGSLTLTGVPPGTWDLMAVFSNGSRYQRWGFQVTGGMTTTITALPGTMAAIKIQKKVTDKNSHAYKAGNGGKAKR